MSACSCDCNNNSSNSKHGQTITLFARIGLLLSICLLFGALHLFVTPFPRRFFCTDQSLRYPIPPGSTVPYAICAPVGVLLAVIVIAWLEVLRSPASSTSSNDSEIQLLRRQWRRYRWSNCLFWLYYFCMGCAATELLTVSGKLALGRHRPYFIEACRPDSDIADLRLCNSSHAYPVSVCRPTLSSYEFKDARMSFPSGHTSYSLFVAVFLAGYLQIRLSGCPALRFSLQLGLISIGMLVGYSRVSDYKHHWSDVLGGAALGAVVALAALHTAAAAAVATKKCSAAAAAAASCGGTNGAGPVGDSATSIRVGDADVECELEDDDALVVSGPPRRRRLRDQAAIDAEDAAAAADEAYRDGGNFDDENKPDVARHAVPVARQSDTSNNNGVV